MVIDRDHTAYDPRSTHPLLLSLALAEPAGRGGGTPSTFVVDLRAPEVLDAVRAVFRLPCPSVGHFSRAELFVLWQLGLSEPSVLWDTWVAGKAMSLGRHHKKYKTVAIEDLAAEAGAGEEGER